jgi:dipeptidyl aminopeptidase/acylaminoacyl peptidase
MTHDGFRAAPHGRRTAISVLVVVGLLMSACTSSTSSTAPSSPVTAAIPPAGTANGSMVDINTGKITPLPTSIARSGTYYAVSPDHTMVAYSNCCSPSDPLYVANIDGTGIRQITVEGQDAYGAQWFPDGSVLLYQQRDASTQKLGNLFVQNVATGQRTQITNFDQTQSWGWWFTFPSFWQGSKYVLFQLPSGDPSNPTWDLWDVPVTGGTPGLARRDAGWGGLAYGLASSKGDFAYLSPVSKDDFTGGGLWIDSWDLRAVTPRALVSEGHLTWLRWSPDGSRISYTDGASIFVVNVATGSTTKVAEGGNAEWFDDNTLIVGNPNN